MYSYFDSNTWVTPFGLIFLTAIITAWWLARRNAVAASVDLMNRRALEKVIRKNIKNEALYGADDDGFSWTVVKVEPEHLDVFGDLLGEVVAEQ